MKKVKQRPQFIWGSLIGSIGNIASSVINNNARNKLVKEQMAEQARQNAINNNQLAVNNLNNYYTSQNNLDNAYKMTFLHMERVSNQDALHSHHQTKTKIEFEI